MKISPISQIVTPKSTGYSATLALGMATLSGVSKSKSFRKMHKPLACVSAILTALHIALIEYYHYSYKNGKKTIS